MPATILLVDDEDAVRNLMRITLELHGYQVLAAADAEEALVLSAEYAGQLDLLVTDLMLTRMSGHALVARLAPSRPGLPVVFISGSLSGDEPSPTGAKVAHLAKPFTPRQLLAAVAALLAPDS